MQNAKRCWRVSAASVQGTSHKKTNRPCQDHHRWELLTPPILVAAVADGAGSAAKGDVGAALAVRHSIETISSLAEKHSGSETDNNWRDALVASLVAARMAVLREAEFLKLPSAELATTLLLL